MTTPTTCSPIFDMASIRATQVRHNVTDLAKERTRKGLSCTWIDENEWKAVCSLLYSSSAVDRKKGTARVSAWKARGIVPFPVEITADIVESQLWETECQSSHQTFALLYSMVVTRFINGVTDYGVCRGRKNSSILELVSHYGVPEWLVTMRHEGTHKSLPSLTALRQGIKFAYQWLWTNYWEPQYRTLPSLDHTPSSTVLSQAVHQEQPQLSSPNTAVEESTVSWLRKELNTFRSNTATKRSVKHSKSVAKRLANASPSVLATLISEGLLLYPTDYSVSDLEIKAPLATQLDKFPHLPSLLLHQWRKLLRPMGRHLRMAKGNLIVALVNAVHKPHNSQWRSTLLAAWLGELLSSCRPEASVNRKDEDAVICIDIVGESGLMQGTVQWHSVLEAVQENPGVYTFAIMEECLHHLSVDLSKPVVHGLRHMATLLALSERIGLDSSCGSCATVEEGVYCEQFTELQRKVEEKHNSCGSLRQLEEEEEDHSDDSLSWRKVQRGDWLNCPLGLFPGQQRLSPFSLDLPAAVDGHALPPGSDINRSYSVVTVSSMEEEEEQCSDTAQRSSALFTSGTRGWSNGAETGNGGDASVQLQFIQEAVTLF